ncbi:DUF3224 domain-containing protein [bacterium]|nr:DUF3224 domain-containing protein [bacterium]
MGSLSVASLQRVCTTIRPRGGHEEAVTEIPGAAQLTHGSYVLAYQGLLHGEGILEEVRCYCGKDMALVYGFERVSGGIGDMRGSFVLEHVGHLQGGVLRSRRSVVPGSGTGSFARLRGEIDFADTGGMEYPVLFEYSLS